jgi:class 3 adenylate cyclase/DNA-binding CsgD family transcriptional regulator
MPLSKRLIALRGSSMKRKLAAILAADVVGYGRLMERDEAGTLAALKAMRKELLMPLVAEHQGRIFKLMGDGVLVEFASAVNAVACAVALQKGMAVRNADTPAAKGILLRVGINLGDVMAEGSDLHGEGVIVASRLESLAEPGGICVSGKVRDEIVRKLDLVFDDLGEREVKNIAAPVRVYRVGEPGQRPAPRPSGSSQVVPLSDELRRRARGQSAPRTDGEQGRAESLFVGRQPELDALQVALEDVVSGCGRLVMLVGEPGIGKTRTAQELANRAAQKNIQVLWGRCSEESGAPPYWPWVQVIRHYVRDCEAEALRQDMGAGAADIAEIAPDLRERLPDLKPPPRLEDPAQARFRLFDSLTGFLKSAARRRPLMILIDDLHWADASSLRLLQFVAPELADSRLLLVGTYRDVELSRQHPLSDALGALARVPRFERLRLLGLSLDEVGRFIEAASGTAPSQGLIDSLRGQTDGNPLFLREIVQFLAHEGAFSADATGHAPRRGPAIRIPEGVREVIGRRLNHLSPTCNRMLTVASVIGREFTPDMLLRILDDISEDTLLEALDEALAARILDEIAPSIGRYQFAHALIRETLYDELRTARRTRLHRRIGEAIEQLHHTDMEPYLPQLAHHFSEAAHGTDIEKAIEYATRAGERADALLAYEEEVRFLDMALHALELNEPADEARRGTLLLKLGQAQRKANDFGQAFESFRRCAQSAKVGRSPELFARAAVAYEEAIWRSGIRPDATLLFLLEEALQGVAETDTALRTRTLGGLARVLLYAGAKGRATAYAEQAVAMARRLGDPAILAATLNIIFDFPWEPAGTEERLAGATEMLQAAEQADDLQLVHAARFRRVMHLLELGDIQASEAEIDADEVVVSRIRQPSYSVTRLAFLVMLDLLRGRFDNAERLIDQAMTLSQRVHGGVWGQSDVQMFMLCREQARLKQLAPVVSAIVQQQSATSVWQPGLALLYVELGRMDEARAEFEQLAVDEFGAVPRDGRWTTCIIFLAEVCAALGDAARAATLYRLLLPYAGRNIVIGGGVGCCGAATRYLGLLATTMARWDDAQRHFEDALAMNARMGARPWLAHTQHDYAAMLLARGQTADRERAAALLNEALAVARDLGMRALEERIVGRLGETATPPKAAPAYPDELTPREVAVLRLIAIGRSNADIATALSISLNTVATHVRSILAKTGCANRTEAAAYAMRQGLALTS